MTLQDLQNAQGLEPRLLSLKQACQVLGISRTSLYALLASNQLQSVTVGRRRFVTREAIDEFIASLPTGYRRSA
jgi:excisionase family DNA binding protein